LRIGTTDQLTALLATVNDDAVQVCYDSANAAGLGDDVAAAARRLAPTVRMVHPQAEAWLRLHAGGAS